MPARTASACSSGSRAVTLASPYAGTAGVGQVRSLAGLLTRLAGQCRAVVGALGAHLTVHGATMNFFDLERLRGLISRTAAMDAAATAVVDDIDAVLGPPPWRQGPTVAAGRVPAGGPSPVATSDTSDVVEDVDRDGNDSLAADDGEDIDESDEPDARRR